MVVDNVWKKEIATNHIRDKAHRVSTRSQRHDEGKRKRKLVLGCPVSNDVSEQGREELEQLQK